MITFSEYETYVKTTEQLIYLHATDLISQLSF